MGTPIAITTYFQRHEQKYRLNAFQYHAFLEVLKGFVRQDEYGLTTIYSIYYDNRDFEIARKALEKSRHIEHYVWWWKKGDPKEEIERMKAWWRDRVQYLHAEINKSAE
jgi:hypothetical protein